MFKMKIEENSWENPAYYLFKQGFFLYVELRTEDQAESFMLDNNIIIYSRACSFISKETCCIFLYDGPLC
jgi:hypothetical protein